eukprot:COSAG02_NODE_33383_length_500_cov_9.920200_2_plen_65_part_01
MRFSRAAVVDERHVDEEGQLSREDGREYDRAKGDWLSEAGLRKDGCGNLIEKFWDGDYANGRVRG